MTNDSIETAAPDEGLPDTGNVRQEEYSSTGQTVLATRRGYRFAPSNKDIPVITAKGVNMSSTDAEAVLAEAKTTGVVVFKVEKNEEE